MVETAERIQLRDEFGKMRLTEGKYTPGKIDTRDWREDIQADFENWLVARQ